MNIRAVAAQILTEVLRQRQSLGELLPYPKADLKQQDEALLQALCYGVCRWHIRLEMVSRQLLDKPLKAKDTDIQALLLLGIYQLLFMRIPAHAAVSETVNACKTLGKPWARGLINAVLRRLQREQESLTGELQQETGYRFSHPDWLLTRLQQAWPEDWLAICDANNNQAPMTLRVNRRQTGLDAYLTTLAEQGIEGRACLWSTDGIQLNQACPVTNLPQFNQGAVSVQDEAAQLAAGLMELTPGIRVLDACAAPGGKTCHLLESEPNLGKLVALEYDGQRIVKIKENLERLGLEATLIEGDTTAPEQWWDQEQFDRILLDAPCSATGVIRRHPDIKLLRRNADIDKLATQQLWMLAALWPLLKPGGIMVYATCSILPQENEQVVGQFLAITADAEHRPINSTWGKEAKFGRYLLPVDGGNDGFYYAKLSKGQND